MRSTMRWVLGAVASANRAVARARLIEKRSAFRSFTHIVDDVMGPTTPFTERAVELAMPLDENHLYLHETRLPQAIELVPLLKMRVRQPRTRAISSVELNVERCGGSLCFGKRSPQMKGKELR